jgi:hypothetical protein
VALFSSPQNSPAERLSIIITDGVNRLLQYLHVLDGVRQRDNQGIHDHLGELQNELHDLADYMRRKEAPEVVPPPVELKGRSVGGSNIVSRREPRGAPEYPTTPLPPCD